MGARASTEVRCRDEAEWRRWLDRFGGSAREVWLVFWKKGSGREGVRYGAALDEALCVGWIDSLVKARDADSYARKFTPRTDASRWSPSNLERVRRLESEGRMTERGRAVLRPAARPASGGSAGPAAPPRWLTAALAARPPARENFRALPPSLRRTYLRWVTSAKLPATRARRARELASVLARGERLGLK